MKTNKTNRIQRCLFTAFLLLFCIAADAQDTTDRVITKGGSVIYGTIIEQNFLEKRIRIQTVEGSILVLNMSDIKEITKSNTALNVTSPSEEYKGWTEDEPINEDPRNTKGNKLYRKCRLLLEVGYGVGVEYENNRENRLATNLSVGYQFNPYVYLGLGIGYHEFTENRLNAVPLFLNFRTDFVNKVVNPFFDFKIGYSPLGDFEEAGYASLGLGIRFSHMSLSIASDALAQRVGTRYYKYRYDYHFDIGKNDEIICFNNIFVKIGFDF